MTDYDDLCNKIDEVSQDFLHIFAGIYKRNCEFLRENRELKIENEMLKKLVTQKQFNRIKEKEINKELDGIPYPAHQAKAIIKDIINSLKRKFKIK